MRKAALYLILGSLPLLLIASIQAPLLRYQGEFQTARQLYSEALQDSRRQLIDISQQLRSLPSVKQNIEAGTAPTVDRILNGFIIPGKIDHLAVYDQNCQLISHSDKGMPLSAQCPMSPASSTTTPYFQWRKLDEDPSNDLISPLFANANASYYLVASHYLGMQWRFHHPNLAKSFGRLQLYSGPTQKGHLVFDADDGKSLNSDIAILSSRHPLLMFFPRLAQNKVLAFEPALLTAMVVFIAALLAGLRQIQQQKNGIADAIEKLHLWAEELGSTDEVEHESFKAIDAKGNIHVKGIQDRMSRLMKRSIESIHKAEHEAIAAKQQVQKLESRVLEQQAEHMWLTHARSLHQQMQVCAQSYLQKMDETQSLGEDLSHLAAIEVAKPAQKLFEITQRWDIELQDVSARKFVRSLSERIDAEGRSELESSLRSLIDHAKVVSHSSLNLSLLTQKLLRELRDNGETALHWFRMMGHGEDEQKSVLALLEEGQSLIQMQSVPCQLSYENIVDKQVSVEHLHIPAATLTSVLFHSQMALIENLGSKGHSLRKRSPQAVLSSQLRPRNDRMVLVISLKSDWDEELLFEKSYPAKAEQHINLAMQLLQAYPMKLTKLPPIHGAHALALMWEAAEQGPSKTHAKVQRRGPDSEELGWS